MPVSAGRILRTVRALCLALVLVAAVPVGLSGEISEVVWAIFGLGLVVAWFTSGRQWSKEANILVTAMLIAAFALMLFLSFQTGEWLVNSVTFALLATVGRVMQLHTSRQQFQAIGLSFLIMIAASVMNPDPSFALYFLLYTILLTWTLTYAHIVQRVETLGGTVGAAWKAGRLVSRRFLVGSSLLALVLLFSSMLIFVLFPRLGLGFFSARTRRAESIVGFSDTIELGHFGMLRESERVVLRFELHTDPGLLPPISTLKFRGLSFEKYDGRSWHKMRSHTWPLRPDADQWYNVYSLDRPDPNDYLEVEYDVYQEPLQLESKVLFVISRPFALSHIGARFDRFRGTSRGFLQDPTGDITMSGPAMTSISFSARSGILDVPPERMVAAPPKYPDRLKRVYLQLPDTLDPRIRQLAESVAGDAAHPFTIARKIEDYLSTNYRYSLEGKGPTQDPIATFLFERREGHCEYFATAMVLMLRSLGIPARPVNGFLGATYNEFGGYYTVAEKQAHSWVEVYINPFGWVTFDPTPLREPAPDSDDFFSTMALWMDALRLRWYKWVVEYDLEKQLAVYAKVWNLFSSRENEIRISPDLSLTEMRREVRKAGRTLFSVRNAAALGMGVAILALVLLAVRLIKRKRDQGTRLLDRLANRVRKLARARGLPVTPGTTLTQIGRLAASLSVREDVARITQLIEQARWDPTDRTDPKEIKNLLRSLARLKTWN